MLRVGGLIHWFRRWAHGPSVYQSSSEEEDYDEETSELIEGSIALIDRMRTQGVDLAQGRTVTHLFLGADHDLRRAGKLMAERGYSIEEEGDGRLVLSERTATSEEWARQAVPAMCRTAGEFGLVYDGWDADVTGD
jgi:hypothetical protein